MEYFRSFQDGLPGVPGSGFPARLALAMGGEVDFPGAPLDSMLERSFADSHPGAHLVPGFREAAAAGIPESYTALVDTAEKMVKALPMDPVFPMEKAYAAIRLQVGLAKCLGQARPVTGMMDDGGDGFLLARLSNLKRNAQLESVARISVKEVESQFGRLREVARRFDEEGGFTKAGPSGKATAPGSEYEAPSLIEVNHEEHFVNIGGVKIAIRH